MRIWLVISSFRNDEQVIGIIDEVQKSAPDLFERILVIDSNGTGQMPELIHQRGWLNVEYRTYENNLGSGGNLAERLRIAAGSGADYAYALNHDGHVDPGIVRTLLQAAETIINLGAAYPLGYLISVGLYNLTGTRELPLPRKLVRSVQQGPLINVFWSSSNGALYSLVPAKKGILPWEAMWMAWEDLEYGWRLYDAGYRQVIVRDAVFHDNNEYARSRLGNVTDKPPWRSYYQIRNLILAVRRSRRRLLFYAIAFCRAALECGLILMVRSNKWKRLRLLWFGIIDGIKGVEGQKLMLHD
jgi:GT2 family glycosyltransferase